MAVRLAIRPRLTLPAEPRVVARPRWRLPPLAVPATAYWLGMGVLTYLFAHLGPHPLDFLDTPASQAAPMPPAALPAPAPPPDVEQPAPQPEPQVEAPVAEQHETEPSVTDEPQVADAPNPSRSPSEPPLVSNRRHASRDEDEPVAPPAPAAPREEPAARVASAFPEFTDSSRPSKREHAADGPRIDSLFEKSDDRPDRAPDAPPTAPPDVAPSAPVAVSSCEAAIAHNNEQLTLGGPRGPVDITREAYASILQNGRYLSGCKIPDRTVFEICAAVKEGRAVGITVVSSPPSADVNACVRSAVSRLKFPQNPKLDVTHTRFDAAHR